MLKYFELLSDLSLDQIKEIKGRIPVEPKNVKMQLARQITGQYHGQAAAQAAEAEFEKIFGKTGDGLPDEIEEVTIPVSSDGISLVKLLTATTLAQSGGDARRKVQQGGVRIDQQKVTDIKKMLQPGQEFILQAGKRDFRKVVLTSE
jgi:tyrosyl-tRNA synthetase